jgi:phage shock protein PspC (stress-responsive transcriptional regulator)
MRKVTTINLNNNAYQIDEDGFEALRQYLENAEHALAGNPDRAEIMADLEQAIADKCRLTLGSYKTVVSAAEIERILKEMGPVISNEQESVAADDGNGAAAAGSSASGAAQRPRRLFRILEGQQWTGVCNGLAAFAGVDVTWVRVAFVLLTLFTGGIWLLVYVVLIFVMPIASTAEDLAAAHGQPFNAQELVDRVKKKHEDFRADQRARRRGKRHGQWFAAYSPPTHPAQPHAPGPAARVAGGVMLPVFTVLSAGWFVLMAVAAVAVWQSYGPHDLHWSPGHGQLTHLPRWLPLVAVIAIYALLALPIGAGRRAALYYANGGRPHGWADAWSGLLWVALVAVLLVAAWAALPQLQELLRDAWGWPLPTWRITWS